MPKASWLHLGPLHHTDQFCRISDLSIKQVCMPSLMYQLWSIDRSHGPNNISTPALHLHIWWAAARECGSCVPSTDPAGDTGIGARLHASRGTDGVLHRVSKPLPKPLSSLSLCASRLAAVVCSLDSPAVTTTFRVASSVQVKICVAGFS